MAKTFEDELMEWHSDIIWLCMDITKEKADMVFAWGFFGVGSYEFNACFLANGKVCQAQGLNSDDRAVSEFMTEGCYDLEEISSLCKEYGKQVPTEIKMYYDVKSRGFDARYNYNDPRVGTDKTSGEIWFDWFNEIKAQYEKQ